MRVLDTLFGHFVDIDPKAEVWNTYTCRWEVLKYAILSHTWDPQGEQTYQEMREIQKQYPPPHNYDPSDPNDPLSYVYVYVLFQLPPTSDERASSIWTDQKLSPKIREACRVAYENGYRYLWIDSCCIDKSSSSELSESINSMYQWYAHADVCYAFLPDVPAKEDHQRRGSSFRESRWFTRGWTLQELIAPHDVRFLSMEWKFIGSKESLADVVVDVTKIQCNALLNIVPLDEFSVAQRFSWAADRKTTREEDRAYSLLGIFNINMPTLYGEGEGAFRRLQEEIMRRTPDQSLFAWTEVGALDIDHTPLDDPDVSDAPVELSTHPTPFLARDRNAYRGCMGIKALSHDEVARQLQLQPQDLPARRYEFTPYGICIQLPTISFSGCFPPEHIRNTTDIPLSHWFLVILGCGHENFPGHLLARVCYMQSSGSTTAFLHSGWLNRFDLLPLSPTAITRLRRASGGQLISVKTLYIPQPERDQGARNVVCWKRHDTVKLVLPEKTREALSGQGYTATLRGPDGAHPRNHSVTLSHDTHVITIRYQHTLEERDWGTQALTIDSEVHVAKTSGAVLQGTPDDHDHDLRLVLPQANGHGPASAGSGVSWVDYIHPWRVELRLQDVELADVPGGPAALTVRLGLTLARTNYYLLRIELKTADAVLATSTPVAEV